MRVWVLTNGLFLSLVTAFKAGFLSSRQTSNGWIVTVHPIYSVLLIGLYFMNEIMLLWIYFFLRNKSTGLKWDPTTLADLLALFHGSNVLPDFARLEKSANRFAHRLLWNQEYRIGYWQKGAERKIWYGIGRMALSRSEFTP